LVFPHTHPSIDANKGSIKENREEDTNVKKFETAELEVIKFNVEDVITTSNDVENGENMTDKG
jgi:hypothetical protein